MSRTVGLVLAALLTIGCGQSPSGPMPSSPSPSSPSSSASAEIRDISVLAGDLEPGTYMRAGFEPRISFTVEDGWTVGSIAEGFFDIQQRKGTPDVIAVQFGLVDAAIGAGATPYHAPTVDEALAAIRANPGLHVLDQSASRLGGQEGVVVEVENDIDAHAPILDVPAGRLGIDPGRRLWIALFDTSHGVLAVMVGGPAPGWEEALAIAEPVLESIVIED